MPCMPSPVDAGQTPVGRGATSGLTRLAQAQPAQAPAPAAAPSPAQAASDEPIGNVATLTGTATVIRNKNSMPLKLQDDIFLNDVLQTSANSDARRYLQRRHHVQSHRQRADHGRQLCL